MRLLDTIASVAVLAGLTSALRLDLETHVEIETTTTNVTEYTAVLNTTEFHLCLNNSGSYDVNFFNFSGSDRPVGQICVPDIFDLDYGCVFSCLEEQEVVDVGFYFGKISDSDDNDEFYKIDDEVITWRGASFDLLSSHVEIVQPPQKSLFQTGIARLSEFKDALVRDIFWEEGITFDHVDQ